MHHAKDEGVLVFDAVHDHVFANGQAAESGAKIFRSGTSDIRELGKRDR